jgi:hypothetical protein
MSRISDEKAARWHQIQHGIRMDNLRYREERDRVHRRLQERDRSPHHRDGLASPASAKLDPINSSPRH